MNLNNVKDLNIIYGTIKSAYKFKPDISIITEIDYIPNINEFERALNADDFGWGFVFNYFNKCNKYYKLKYKNITFYVLNIGNLTKDKKLALCKNIYRVYLTSLLYQIKKDFNFYILMNPAKRKFPNKNKIVEAKHINGGFTYMNGANIYIVRYEDYEKVIIHELLHHNKVMHYDSWDHNNLIKLKKFNNIELGQKLIPNEAIIEVFACILNAIFYSIEKKQSFTRLLKRDREHNLMLAGKILELQGNKKWFEKSNSYCYVVYKAIFYIYFKEFLKIYKYYDDTIITNFIVAYFPKLLKQIKQIKLDKKKSLKLTIF